MPLSAPKTVLLQSSGCFAARRFLWKCFCLSAKLWSLLTRQIPLENKSIFSGSLFQYLEDNKKWRERFLFIPDSYNIHCYDSKAVRVTSEHALSCATEVRVLYSWHIFFAPSLKCQSHNKHHQPKATINCAGYKVLTSIDSYLELINNSLPGRERDLWEGQYSVFFFFKCWKKQQMILSEDGSGQAINAPAQVGLEGGDSPLYLALLVVMCLVTLFAWTPPCIVGGVGGLRCHITFTQANTQPTVWTDQVLVAQCWQVVLHFHMHCFFILRNTSSMMNILINASQEDKFQNIGSITTTLLSVF